MVSSGACVVRKSGIAFMIMAKLVIGIALAFIFFSKCLSIAFSLLQPIVLETMLELPEPELKPLGCCFGLLRSKLWSQYGRN